MRKLLSLLSLIIITGLMVGGLIMFTHAMIIPAKAFLSPYLLNHAWEEKMNGATDPKPWPWMDSTPVAKIHFKKQDKSYIIMKGVSGSVLAFSPGWHEQTALPASNGITVLSAHRDTHFSLLRDLIQGDEIELQTGSGTWSTYQVDYHFVTDESRLGISEAIDQSVLYLTTCYPFDNIGARSDQRYVVVARKV